MFEGIEGCMSVVVWYTMAVCVKTLSSHLMGGSFDNCLKLDNCCVTSSV